MKITIAAETFELLAQRALWWSARATLFVADLHLGKADYFRRHSLAIPSGDEPGDLERLGKVVKMTKAKRVVVLGDFFHARMHDSSELQRDFLTFKASLEPVEWILVRGNHDLRAGDPNPNWGINCIDQYLDSGILGCHHAGGHEVRSEHALVVAGHLHPVVKLSGVKNERIRLPVFWLHGSTLILPSFGSFTGGAEIQPSVGDGVYAVTADGVVRVKV